MAAWICLEDKPCLASMLLCMVVLNILTIQIRTSNRRCRLNAFLYNLQPLNEVKI